MVNLSKLLSSYLRNSTTYMFKLGRVTRGPYEHTWHKWKLSKGWGGGGVQWGGVLFLMMNQKNIRDKMRCTNLSSNMTDKRTVNVQQLQFKYSGQTRLATSALLQYGYVTWLIDGRTDTTRHQSWQSTYQIMLDPSPELSLYMKVQSSNSLL